MKLVSNTGDGQSVELEIEDVGYSRKLVVDASLPAVVYDRSIINGDVTHDFAISIGDYNFPCNLAVPEETAMNNADNGLDVRLNLQLTFEEAYRYEELKLKPSVSVRLLMDGEEVHSLPLKMEIPTNECIIRYAVDMNNDTILVINNIQDIFDQKENSYVIVDGLGIIGFEVNDKPLPVGCRGYQVKEGETRFTIPISTLTKVFYIIYGEIIDGQCEQSRIMYWDKIF